MQSVLENKNIPKTPGCYLFKETLEEIEAKRIRSSKPILQFTLEGILVEEFTSAKEAHLKYGFSQCRIGLCCNGKIKKYKNYVWKFKQ